MTDSFEDWINGMTNDQYENWLDREATEAQEEKALNIREPPNQEELEAMRRAQEYAPEQSQREIDVGDNRDLPPIRRNVDIIMPPTGNAPIRIEPTTTQQPPTTIQYPQVNRIPQPQIQPRPNITTRIKSFFGRVNPFKKAKK